MVTEERYSDGVIVVRASESAPREAKGEALFKRLLQGQTELLYIDFHLDGGTVLEPHRHNAHVAAAVTRGALVFGVGPALSERIRLGVGDVIVVPTGVPHAEEAEAGEPMEAVVAALRPFDTTPLYDRTT